MKFKALSNNECKLDLNWDRINLYVSRYKPNTSFEVQVVRRKSKRSDPLRSYYFAAVLPPFMEKEGYEPHEMMLFHHQAKARYFEYSYKVLDDLNLPHVFIDNRGIARNVPSVFGNESPIPVEVKKKFVDWVIRRAATAGAYIEDPK